MDKAFLNTYNGISTRPFTHADFCLSLQHILKALLYCVQASRKHEHLHSI